MKLPSKAELILGSLLAMSVMHDCNDEATRELEENAAYLEGQIDGVRELFKDSEVQMFLVVPPEPPIPSSENKKDEQIFLM